MLANLDSETCQESGLAAAERCLRFNKLHIVHTQHPPRYLRGQKKKKEG